MNISLSFNELIIGFHANFARRKNNTWFLAVMNGVAPKKIKVPLSFLKGPYIAEAAKDNATESASVLVEHKAYSAKDTIELNLASGGGFIAMFKQK